MSYKRYLIPVLLVCAFLAVLAGGWLSLSRVTEHREQTAMVAAFTPATVPDEISADFAGQFNAMRKANEPLMLPDEVFYDHKGKPVRFSDFKGRPILVNFWATWCAPCVVELPSINAFRKYYGDRLQVIAVAMENNKTHKQINAFLDSRGVGTFAGYVDMDGNLARTMDMRGIPTSYLIAEDGHILYRFEGDADWASLQSKAFFDSFISSVSKKLE